MAAKKQKTKFTDLVFNSDSELADNTPLTGADYIYEVVVVRKFKAKFDEGGTYIKKGGK